MSDKKRSTKELLAEMREVAKAHEDMKAVVSGMLDELNVFEFKLKELEDKHGLLAEEIKNNTKK